MLAEISGAETIVAKIEELFLDRTFDVVILGSALINTPNDEERAALLATCRRHVVDNGVVLVERYVPSRLENLANGLLDEHDGLRCSLENVNVNGSDFSATIVYEALDATWTQSFSAIILHRSALERELSNVSLKFIWWLDDRQSWFSARPSIL